MIRLGDGTETSKQKIETALKNMWAFGGELLEATEDEKILIAAGILPDFEPLKELWRKQVEMILTQATLEIPATRNTIQTGGKTGRHSEHLSYLLAEMQSVQRAYPGLKW